MWDHGEAPAARPPPLAFGFAGERYLFVRVSAARGLAGPEVSTMPANNLTVVFRRA
jgi:hypothetical protein